MEHLGHNTHYSLSRAGYHTSTKHHLTSPPSGQRYRALRYRSAHFERMWTVIAILVLCVLTVCCCTFCFEYAAGYMCCLSDVCYCQTHCKGKVHPNKQIHMFDKKSLSNHPHADGKSGEVSLPTKHLAFS